MRKRDLITGIVYILAGVVCLVLEIFLEPKHPIVGFAVFCFFYGGRLLWDYLYWNKPDNRERRQEYIENEDIELHDERNEKIREKAGRYTYTFSIYFLSITMFLLAILDSLRILENTEAVIFTLFTILIVQIIAEQVFMRYLKKKY